MSSSLSFVRAALFLVVSLLMPLAPLMAQSLADDPVRRDPTVEELRRLGLVPPEKSARAESVTAAPVPAPPVAPMPADPASGKPQFFGNQLFSGRFSSLSFSGFNPDYQIAVGDRITVRMWGGHTYEATLVVDAQGNIFIPNVGPVRVIGVRNGVLNEHVTAQTGRVFRSNVGVYATLEAAQPVKIYVTGFVRAPGLYGGLSSDSVLYYLDKAGGIDPDRGSYLEVDVMRAGAMRAKVNLYRFLLGGSIEPLQLQDGDTLVVYPRKFSVRVAGEVLNPYIFEFVRRSFSAAELFAVARPRPEATHFNVVRRTGAQRRSEYHPLANAAQVTIEDGDEVTVTSDQYPGTILVRIEGAHLGERTLVLPYGSTLKDALTYVRPAPQANMEALQLYRRSVAQRQKELLDQSLRGLETAVLTARSSTAEEAQLRAREADLVLRFVERARNVETRGQVVLANRTEAGATILEDGDVIRVPERSNLVLVSGEVIMPNALVHTPQTRASEFIARAGGFTQNADTSRLVLISQDGSVATVSDGPLAPGDQVMVLPKVESKNIEIARGITQIIYQIAVGAAVVLGL